MIYFFLVDSMIFFVLFFIYNFIYDFFLIFNFFIYILQDFSFRLIFLFGFFLKWIFFLFSCNDRILRTFISGSIQLCTIKKTINTIQFIFN